MSLLPIHNFLICQIVTTLDYIWIIYEKILTRLDYIGIIYGLYMKNNST
jgi:hypothetical protein